MNARSPSDGDVPNLRARIRQATDAAILEAAEHVFAEQGLDGARVNDIAARAGVAVGTLYNHFKDREALLQGLLELRQEEVLALLDQLLDETGLDFAERVRQLYQRFFRYVDAHRPFYSIMHDGRAEKSVDMMRAIYARMERLAKRGIKEKALRPSGADLYPALLMGTIRAAIIKGRLSGKHEVDVDELARFFLEGAGTK